jgi:hypothetical protein
MNGQHHPKVEVDCLYVSRKYRGRGLMQLQEVYIIEITKVTECVDSTEDSLIQVVRTHQNNTKSAMVQTDRSLRTELQKGTRHIKDSTAQKTKERWQGKGCMDNFHIP